MFTVSKVTALQDKNTGIPVGSAVVSFETRDDMEAALKYPEHKVDGKVVSRILFPIPMKEIYPAKCSHTGLT